MRVMTFNIRGANYPDGVNSWEQRAALNSATIKRCAPDLLAMQEVQLANINRYLFALLEYSYYLGPQYNIPPFYDYPIIYWRRDRFKKLASGGFWLSATPEVYSASWGTKYIRSAAWVKLQDLASGQSFLHLNTHLDHISEEARVRGSELILQRLAELRGDLPVSISGDFNSNPQSATHKLFLAAGFNDSFLARGHHDDPADASTYTTHYFQGAAYQPANFHGATRIDWLLTSPELTATSYEVVRDAAPPVYPSDHYPVLVELERANAEK